MLRLFVKKNCIKKISLLSETKNLDNPYEIYQFEDFMKLNFENFKKKKTNYEKSKNIKKSISIRI